MKGLTTTQPANPIIDLLEAAKSAFAPDPKGSNLKSASNMLVLVIIGYYKKDSFCHKGIKETVLDELIADGIKYIIIDLYEDEFDPSYQEKNKLLIQRYQRFIKRSTHIVFISPVWWFRCTSMLEGFFDQVFTPNFAYKFKQITSTYGLPVPLLKDKRVLTYLTHGAPALPVLTLYLNSVKLRLSLGVFSFTFGWFNAIIRQFFSVPFCSEEKRKKYLKRVRKDISREIKDFHDTQWLT